MIEIQKLNDHELIKYYDSIEVKHITIETVMELIADLIFADPRDIIHFQKVVRNNFTYLYIHYKCNCGSEHCLKEAKGIFMFANIKSMKNLHLN